MHARPFGCAAGAAHAPARALKKRPEVGTLHVVEGHVGIHLRLHVRRPFLRAVHVQWARDAESAHGKGDGAHVGRGARAHVKRPDDGLAAQDGSGHDVSQFAHVARPGIPLQLAPCVACDLPDVFLVFPCVRPQEMVG